MKTKIDFIVENYCSLDTLVIFPLVSTVGLLTIIPFITNGAYWLDLKFNTWRIAQKNQIEGKQLLTLEQSLRLRTEMRELEESFDKLLGKKDEEIKLLKSQIEEGQAAIASNSKVRKKTSRSNKGSSYSIGDYNSLKRNAKIFEVFEEMAQSIKETSQFPDGIDEKIKEYFIVNEVVDETTDAWGNKAYSLTYKGEEIYKEHFNRTFNPEV